MQSMYVTEDKAEGLLQITAYDDHSVTVSERVLQAPFILFTNQLITDLQIKNPGELDIAQIKPILDYKPEVLIIGTGLQSLPITPILREHLEQNSVGVETMTTKAACRSYMALLSEARNLAGLFFV